MSIKRPARVIAGTTTLVTMMSATLLMVPTSAHATFGTADIKPIESNIAAKAWASATAGSGSSSAGLAIDGDPTTSWYPGRAGAGSGSPSTSVEPMTTCARSRCCSRTVAWPTGTS